MAEKKNPHMKVIEIDEVNILSIDKAVYDWFDKKHPTILKGRKVPVLFGSWERFAQMQGNKEDENLNNLRDHNGMLKLPIISIKRGDIEPNNDRYRPISLGGEPSITISKKIAGSAFDKTRRVPFHDPYKDGLRGIKKEAPVYEVQRLPFPDFINVPYTVTFWSSYIRDSNLFHDKIWGEYFISDMEYKGYFFYALFDSSSNEGNLDDFSGEERIIRSSFNLRLEAYLIKKNEVEISRTPSKIIMEENIIQADEFDFQGSTIDEILGGDNVTYPI
tara:strand:+ start:6565 stop:7389 length:825 start_codon:yes stop_codon:yes gene_type:complete